MSFLIGKATPRETGEPPPSLQARGVKAPPTYVYTQRREPRTDVTFLMVPWDQHNSLYDLNIGWHEAPDPIRQSDHYADGNKIHPTAQMRIVTSLAIGAKEAVADDTFKIGKLLGYIKRPMYAGQQHPSLIRANIAEALPSTYGSQYVVDGIMPAGPEVVTPTGFAVPFSQSPGIDGYPY